MSRPRSPFGVPLRTARRVQQQLLDAASATVETSGGATILRGVYTQIGSALQGFGPPGPGSRGAGGSHLVGVQVALVPSDQREIGSLEFVDAWRTATAQIAGIETLTFDAETGVSEGAAIDIQLTHRARAHAGGRGNGAGPRAGRLCRGARY